LLADSRHRKLEIEDAIAGARLRPSFEDAGWVCDRNAVMRREGPGRAHGDVEEVELADTRALRIEWYLSYEHEPDTQEAIVLAQDRVSFRRGMRAFVVREGGDAVGFAHLAASEGEDAAEIDQLYVTPSARSQGLGGRLVEAALAAGGRDVAWVVADDEGQARALYERLGFVTVWRQHAFVRQP
jgi:ribosomal protein S18 acetylase RimI-like enzyme